MHDSPMQKRSSKKDINEKAFSIVQMVTGSASTAPVEKSDKNPAAVALGRLGGLKGGRARAESLSASKRSSIAKNAAIRRWASNKSNKQNDGQ